LKVKVRVKVEAHCLLSKWENFEKSAEKTLEDPACMNVKAGRKEKNCWMSQNNVCHFEGQGQSGIRIELVQVYVFLQMYCCPFIPYFLDAETI
jgi:hypothetical protein